MPKTSGLDHLGLAVRDLDTTTGFFVKCLGWLQTAQDLTYPRNTVTDGSLRLTLWQADKSARAFDRHTQIGLHHLALSVPDHASLIATAELVAGWPGVTVEFMPEPMGDGPRQHMMFAEPGGLRLELVWNGD
ncbi:VOC family protein [Pseudosulfitobacter sp. DSM 107133]|uniref:VOC family protein n=1 Tax=Pseudosulfitobacter sp. DSM 107133 TaxID=2883100 RepID=UPI000DF4B6CC|nr:VOC family protein [Pseudosulfitobacter sp. DSM 107133]UOA28396.1 2-epi-5-epi-valiolone epimerase [Pseudosulfitobacter sp. DSM 107133]